ncbi:MAG: type IV secretion system protein [Rickettsiaceae bacterium]
MIQWAFPFMLNGMSQFASWIINASPDGLCQFADVAYPDNLRHLRLWDALDCRISHYLGLDAMQTMIVENANKHNDFSRFDILSNAIPPYVFLLIPAIISGYPQLVSLALMYPLLVISIGAFVVNATVVCMISIVVLGVLAPLFVPMLLFNYTRRYFDAWVKLLLSFMLQPMVAVVFMTTMMSVYDMGFYGTCKYEHRDFAYSGPTFNVRVLPNLASSTVTVDGRSARYFYVDQDWSKYSQEEVKGCKDSLGFILNNPLTFLFDTGSDWGKKVAMPWLEDSSGDANKKRFDFLGAIKSSPGMFFSTVEILFEKIKTLAISMLTACLILYLMYHFSESLAEFAADMTEGVVLNNVAIKPQTLYKAGQAIAGAAGGLSSDQAAAGGEGGATDKASTGRGGASDKFSTGDKGASDTVSTGGGGAVDKVATGADSLSKDIASGGVSGAAFKGLRTMSSRSKSTSDTIASSVKRQDDKLDNNSGEKDDNE